MSGDIPLKSVNPKSRHGVIGGRNLSELIRSVIAERIGQYVADVIHIEGILESLLEEFFFGGTLQDEFYSQLSDYKVPADHIHFVRQSVLTSIAVQVRLVFGEIMPCNHYTFQMLPDGDIMVTEQTPRLPYTRINSER